ncbi:VanZ family protein [Tuberibacillus calidus]|uniref:VanZ family protein n=1 Tax=Tuberibacillus calidus TaxID=340097 RepID=UPI000421F117|nr:VanZ family protein [Tuberibacillus calidus]
MIKKWLDWLLVLIWCGMIFYFTSSPLFTGTHTAHWIREMMTYFHIGSGAHIDDGMFSWNYVIRKLTHLTVFGILAFLIWRALVPQRHAKGWAWLLTTLYAATDEWHQSFQPGRSPKVTDVAIDACGALIALFVMIPIFIHKKKGRND